ncbi:hypothetical protein P2A78_20760 [Xanthomonas perforans]|uniref:ParB/Sulfiredoxin domain-containing protein n=1 Tax=Xanthomonas hortorum pv. gardneri TaxID=2754056 RepID=A0A6V7FIA8_9XANT|nr:MULTISPECIES: hypothetical protein [Xanthomonas]APP82728.1 hypothetical protein BJD10_23950 [Xanthomonas hortorum pv. gardneri]APR13365.1 hypothetical protein BI314_24395 [Xanthomonas citri pv. citri]APR17991.1 hypothetical protein BI315_24230 [Xanthomonas citri pv. citri]APR22691.1 hypothetical protein BI316_24310 [Xanthomonas citri pv. citri]APR27328.1 hypothetical protein BJD09_24180 [Xanthomonas citri pv. citri]
MSKMIRVDSLPSDMQQLLADLADDAGVSLPEQLPLRYAALSAFPDVVIGNSSGDQRDAEYVNAMKGCILPPLLVSDGILIDGRHRIASLRMTTAVDAPYLDLTDVLPAPAVPRIGAMR